MKVRTRALRGALGVPGSDPVHGGRFGGGLLPACRSPGCGHGLPDLRARSRRRSMTITMRLIPTESETRSNQM